MTIILKKIITHLLYLPGILIVLIVLSFFFFKKRPRIIAVFIIVALYGFSIEPTKDALMLPLENTYPIPSINEVKTCDVYVVLGSRTRDNAPDAYGKGTLDGDGIHRAIGAYRLYLIHQKPILYSGGKLFEGQSEAEIARKLLLSLGVKDKDIIPESRSRDTYENAKYTKQICSERNYKRIVLVTSAFHMKRAVILFRKHFSHVVPYPTDYKTSRSVYTILSFLPEAENMSDISLAMKEYLGILFYKFSL